MLGYMQLQTQRFQVLSHGAQAFPHICVTTPGRGTAVLLCSDNVSERRLGPLYTEETAMSSKEGVT
jgi:hypothetical protein